MSKLHLAVLLIFAAIQVTSCTKEETRANILIEIELAESERFELLALPINYIRTFSNTSIGTLGFEETRSLNLRERTNPDLVIYDGSTFPRLMEGIDPSFGLALLRDRQSGEEFELPVCEPRMVPLDIITDISAGSKFRITLPFDLQMLHEIEGVTYIDLTMVTARITEQ